MIYKCLSNSTISLDRYSLIPIRFEDRYKIMQWRNDQIYHLRQSKPLTEEEQDDYFNEVVAKLFDQQQPNQILFSYLENGECIGYGGLVHINWVDKNAEVSFIIDTTKEEKEFDKHWTIYLKLLEEIAFTNLSLHKIFTYAFDLRAHLYKVLENNAFKKEAELKEHCLFNNHYISVIIHSKLNYGIEFSIANDGDLIDAFNWVNNENIRTFSFNKNKVSLEEHKNWFSKKIRDRNCLYLIANIDDNKVGSIRFDVINSKYAQISYLLHSDWHGRGLGLQLLFRGANVFFEKFKNVKEVRGLVLKENKASLKLFNNLGYSTLKEDDQSIVFNKFNIL